MTSNGVQVSSLTHDRPSLANNPTRYYIDTIYEYYTRAHGRKRQVPSSGEAEFCDQPHTRRIYIHLRFNYRSSFSRHCQSLSYGNFSRTASLSFYPRYLFIISGT